MSIFVIHNSHELHQLKKVLRLPPGRYDYLSALSFQLKQQNYSCFCRASFPLRGAGAFWCRFFEKAPESMSLITASFRFTRQLHVNRNGGT